MAQIDLPYRLEGAGGARGVHDSEGDAKKRSLLQALLPTLLELSPELAPILMTAGNSVLYQEITAVMYADLEVEVPQLLKATLPVNALWTGSPNVSKGFSKLRRLERFPGVGYHVRNLVFQESLFDREAGIQSTSPLLVTPHGSQPDDRASTWNRTSVIASLCPRVESLKWNTGLGIGRQLWETISSMTDLKHLSLVYPAHYSWCTPSVSLPKLTPTLRLLVPFHHVNQEGLDPDHTGAVYQASAVGQGGWGLGLGWERLENLEIQGLSQAGAKTLGVHFRLLCSRGVPPLRQLMISTPFLDSTFCSSIAYLGTMGRLEHLELNTSGTKLTGEALKEIIESSPRLKSLYLRDIEGRLEKDTWASIEDWPQSFRSLEIDVAESSCHHSWVLHHLTSLHRLPLGQISAFAVRRILHPVAALPFPPPDVNAPTIPAGHNLQPIPTSLLDALCTDGSLLEKLCIDWWELDQGQLERLLKGTPKLRHLQVAVSDSMAKIIAMNNAFAAVPRLENLIVTSQPIYNTAAPKVQKKADDNELHLDLPPEIAEKISVLDPTLPEVRDLRKFVRRLPFIREITWTGRGGKGTWRFATDNKKKSSLIGVEFIHSAITTLGDWKLCQNPPKISEYEVDENQNEQVLEMPIPPHTPGMSDFPALSRITTGNSSQTSIVTPRSAVTPSSVTSLSKGDRHSRRASVPAVAKAIGILGLADGPAKPELSPPPKHLLASPVKIAAKATKTTDRDATTSVSNGPPTKQQSDPRSNRSRRATDPVQETRHEKQKSSPNSQPQSRPSPDSQKSQKSKRSSSAIWSTSVPYTLQTHTPPAAPVHRIVPGAGRLQKFPAAEKKTNGGSQSGDAVKKEVKIGLNGVGGSGGAWTTVGETKKAPKNDEQGQKNGITPNGGANGRSQNQSKNGKKGK